MKQKLTKIVLIGMATLYVAGCTIFERPKLEPPKKDDYSHVQGHIWDNRPYHTDLFIRDIDKDGKADQLHLGGFSYWVAHEFKDKTKNHGNTRPLTGDLRKAATKAMKADQELGYLLAQDAYKSQQAK